MQAVIARCALDIARGIAHLHASNIVHGDLKPQNVMLSSTSATPSGQSGAPTPAPKNFPYTAKLTDFGLSFHIGHNRTHMSNMRIGTPFYYAPVRAPRHVFAPKPLVRTQATSLGPPTVCRSADVCACGALLWQTFHGLRRAPPGGVCCEQATTACRRCKARGT